MVFIPFLLANGVEEGSPRLNLNGETATARNLQPSWEDGFKGSPIMVTHVAQSSSTLIFLIPLHRGTSALCQKCCLSSSGIVLSVVVLRLPNEMET